MRDISNQPRSLRRSVATARLAMDAETILRVSSGEWLRGDPLGVARVAAIQAVKAAGQLIPHCHPVAVEYAGVEFEIGERWVDIRVEVRAIHRSDLDTQAMTGASIAALAMYDMLKTATADIEITGVKLQPGKHPLQAPGGHTMRAGILVLSDGVSSGERNDTSGSIIRDRLEGYGVSIERFVIQPDEADAAFGTLQGWCDDAKLDFALVTGGTGLGPRDIAPEVMDRLIERRLPGVEEAMRAHGQERMPFAMLSRGRAGQRGCTVLVALPGSPKGVAESLDAVLPALLHAVPMMAGGGHGS